MKETKTMAEGGLNSDSVTDMEAWSSWNSPAKDNTLRM
jgi:hypothetical protein